MCHIKLCARRGTSEVHLGAESSFPSKPFRPNQQDLSKQTIAGHKLIVLNYCLSYWFGQKGLGGELDCEPYTHMMIQSVLTQKLDLYLVLRNYTFAFFSHRMIALHKVQNSYYYRSDIGFMLQSNSYSLSHRENNRDVSAYSRGRCLISLHVCYRQRSKKNSGIDA